jgi:hypothetical protein
MRKPLAEVVATWFGEDELDVCPRCNGKTLIPEVDSQLRVCLRCGVVAEGRPPLPLKE